jgi:hypothetical protein
VESFQPKLCQQSNTDTITRKVIGQGHPVDII